jgi:hypothetical protein
MEPRVSVNTTIAMLKTKMSSENATEAELRHVEALVSIFTTKCVASEIPYDVKLDNFKKGKAAYSLIFSISMRVLIASRGKISLKQFVESLPQRTYISNCRIECTLVNAVDTILFIIDLPRTDKFVIEQSITKRAVLISANTVRHMRDVIKVYDVSATETRLLTGIIHIFSNIDINQPRLRAGFVPTDEHVKMFLYPISQLDMQHLLLLRPKFRDDILDLDFIYHSPEKGLVSPCLVVTIKRSPDVADKGDDDDEEEGEEEDAKKDEQEGNRAKRIKLTQ